MKLNQNQKSSISQLIYTNVKYNETYLEVLDHVFTSLETEADEKITFRQKLNQIWVEDFGGYENLPVLEKTREKEVNRQIGKRHWKLFFSYFKPPLLLITLALGIVLFYLTLQILTESMNNKMIVILLFIAAFVPISIYVYMYFRLKKYNSIKPSIKDSRVYHTSGYSLSIINCFMFFSVFFDLEPGAILKTMTPSLLFLVTFCFIIYAMSYFRLYKETFKMEITK